METNAPSMLCLSGPFCCDSAHCSLLGRVWLSVRAIPTSPPRAGEGNAVRHYGGSYAWFTAPSLVAETNSERASGANEIPFGTHGFEFADGLADLDRADLRPVERDHLSEVASSNEFHRRRAEHRAERAIKRGRDPPR